MSALSIRSITLVIASRGRVRQLARTVRSVFACKPPSGCRVNLVLISSACQDTLDELERLSTEAPAWLLVQVAMCRQSGKSRAVNLGLTLSQADVVGFTDDDVLMHSLWFEELVRGFSTTGADALQGQVTVQLDGVSAPAWWSRHCEAMLASTTYLDEQPSTPLPSLNSCNMAVRWEAVQAAGWWCESLGPGTPIPLGDDDEWTSRMHTAGYRFAYWAEMSVSHLIPGQRVNMRFLCRRIFQTGILSGARSRERLRQTLAASVARVPVEALRALELLGRGRPSAAADRVLQFARHCGIIWGVLGHRLPRPSRSGASKRDFGFRWLEF